MRDVNPIPPSEITPESEYWDRGRRHFLRTLGAGTMALTLPSRWAHAESTDVLFKNATKSRYSTDEPLTAFSDAVSKTRFRELEEDIAKNSVGLQTRPWTVAVEGEGSVAKFAISAEVSMLAGITQTAKRRSWISKGASSSGTLSLGACGGTSPIPSATDS